MIDADRASEGDKAPQIRKRKNHAVGIQASGRGDSSPETTHDFLIKERKQRSSQSLKHDETERVRAEIDDTDAFNNLNEITTGHRISALPASDDSAVTPCRVRTSSGLS